MGVAAKTADPPAHDDLSDLVRRALEQTDDLQSAARALLAMCRSRPALYRVLMAQHEYDAARAAVGRLASHNRRLILSRPADPAPANKRAMHLAQVTSSAFLDFRLPGGRRLGQATAEQVREGAAFYIGRADDAYRKGTWLARIAKALPEGKTVAEQFADADLAQMLEDAE